MKKTTIFILWSLLLTQLSAAQDFDSLAFKRLEVEYKGLKKKIQKNNGVFIDGKVVYIVMDSNGDQIEGIDWPTALRESKQYRYRVVVVTDKSDKATYKVKIDGKEYNPAADFTVVNTAKIDTGRVDFTAEGRGQELIVIESELSEVFSEKVFIEVKKTQGKKDTTIRKWDIKLLGGRTYHVAIMGGYFHSGLNNPTKIVKAPLFNSTDSTLIGDFTNHQRKLAVMAVFYPWQRNSDYQWKNLKFYERFSFGFGIGLDENPFDDLFGGINLEFARGGYISAGVHCGKHNVLATKPEFDYGNDIWNQPFDNSLIKEEWGLSYYIGVTIDFRVITSMIGTRDKLNNEG